MAHRWIIHRHDPGVVASIEKTAQVTPVVAQLLAARGMTHPDEIRKFLDVKLNDLYPPNMLPGAEAASERIVKAIAEKRQIVIYGDYDADGMTATAILMLCLKALGADCRYFVPNRLDDGYGLNSDAINRLADEGASVVVSVDCGITSVDEAKVARERNIELIITDHHQPKSDLPDAAEIVHPGLVGGGYPFPGLCGAGVALKLAWSICQRVTGADKVRADLREYLLHAMGLAAIGTIADVVPLLDENRAIARHGLVSLKQRHGEGLNALFAETKIQDKSRFSAEDVAFTIAPHLNAAGRLGMAALGVELLTTDRPERAAELAKYIHQTLNSDRGSLERRVYRAANDQIKTEFDAENDPAFVLAGKGWHAGVIGIVAGRLAEKYHRPVLVISIDETGNKLPAGSGRSGKTLNLHQALASCGEFLNTHGGHAAAAGFTLEESAIAGFRDAFCEVAASERSTETYVRDLHIDAETPLAQLTTAAVTQIDNDLAPFGEANPRPLLCTSGVQLAEPPKLMGAGERHLSLKLQQGPTNVRAVAFSKAEWAEELEKTPGLIDIAYRPVINEFRGIRKVEVHLVDWRPTE